MMKRRLLKENSGLDRSDSGFDRSESEEYSCIIPMTPKRKEKFPKLAEKKTKEIIFIVLVVACIFFSVQIYGTSSSENPPVNERRSSDHLTSSSSSLSSLSTATPPKPISSDIVGTVNKTKIEKKTEKKIEKKTEKKIEKKTEKKIEKTCVITTSILNKCGFVFYLYESVMKNNPSINCFVWFLVDNPMPPHGENEAAMFKIKRSIRSLENFQIVTLDTVQKSNEDFHFQIGVFSNDPLDFQAKFLPFAFQYTFHDLKADHAIFLNTDVWVTGSFQDLQKELSHRSVVLTPHMTKPTSLLLDNNKHSDNDPENIPTDIFNTDFVALSNTPSTRKFITFWEHESFQHTSTKFSNSQVLLHVIDFLDDHEFLVIRDQRYNVATWNLHERGADLQILDGTLYIKNTQTNRKEKVVFMNFSNLPVLKEKFIDHYTSYRKYPRLKDVMLEYLSEITSRNVLKYYHLPYGYDHLSNGIEIKPWLRKFHNAASFSTQNFETLSADDVNGKPLSVNVYLRTSYQNNADWKNPFCCNKRCLTDKKKITIFEWMISTTPAWSIDLTGSFFFSPLEKQIWENRPDLQSAFPNPYAVNQEWKQWVITNAVKDDLMDKKVFKVWSNLWMFHNNHHSKYHKSFEKKDNIGINIYGWFGGQFSIGIVAQKYLYSARKADLPVNAIGINFKPDSLSFVAPSSLDIQTTRSMSENFNLVIMNADTTQIFLDEVPQEVRDQKYNIAMWFWELSTFPENWMHFVKAYDEIWVASKFVKNSIENSKLYDGTIVKTLPIPEDAHNNHTSSTVEKNDLNSRLPQILKSNLRDKAGEKPFVFLVVFDFNSFVERKNPSASICAFVEAFPLSEDPHGKKYQLIIKSHSGTEEQVNELRGLAKNDPRVFFINSLISSEENIAMHQYQDCYVSLHRSEGYGMNILESMASGIPVIATNYSGNADFFAEMPDLTNKCAFPVEYKLIELKETFGPYVKGNFWAEADHESAVRAMRRAVKYDCKKSKFSKTMIEEVDRHYGYKAIGKKMKSLLVEAFPRMKAKIQKKRNQEN